jgi:hypothetical protein
MQMPDPGDNLAIDVFFTKRDPFCTIVGAVSQALRRQKGCGLRVATPGGGCL